MEMATKESANKSNASQVWSKVQQQQKVHPSKSSHEEVDPKVYFTSSRLLRWQYLDLDSKFISSSAYYSISTIGEEEGNHKANCFKNETRGTKVLLESQKRLQQKEVPSKRRECSRHIKRWKWFAIYISQFYNSSKGWTSSEDSSSSYAFRNHVIHCLAKLRCFSINAKVLQATFPFPYVLNVSCTHVSCTHYIATTLVHDLFTLPMYLLEAYVCGTFAHDQQICWMT